MNEQDNLKELIIGIDPGTFQSAYVITDLSNGMKILSKGIILNSELYITIEKALQTIIKAELEQEKRVIVYVAIEFIESKGMPVGRETFETCYFIGELNYRFRNLNDIVATLSNNSVKIETYRVYRHEEKTAICGNSRAKDSNIRQALIDKYGIVGTKKQQGFFYGVKRDIWQAFAVAETFNIML